MCLDVEEIPNKLIMALPVVKQLVVSIGSNGFTEYNTPFQDTLVNRRILIAAGKKAPVRRGSSIDSGYIHSWKYGAGYSCDNEVPLMAYALGVEAFGDYDVASIALYIPKFDPNCRSEEKKLYKLLRKRGLTFAELLVEFPELAVAKKRFKALEAKYQK